MENAEDGANAEQQGKRLPSFLKKIYDLADDSETNSLISWNSNGTSVIIWDHNKFSVELQNKHFKSNNFSSIISQFNNYGFRKIAYDRHEYAHIWFQSGKRHLLKNIKRKKPPSEFAKKRNHSTFTNDSSIATMETELNDMKTEQNELKQQIQNLKNSMDNMAHEIETLQAHKNRVSELAVSLNQLVKENGDFSTGNKNSVSELTDEDTNIAVLLNQLAKENGDCSTGNNTKKPKLNADGESGSSTEDQMVRKARETPADFVFLINMLNDEKERRELNAKQGDLADQHAKAMMFLDDMMEAEIAMETENLITNTSDQNEEDGQVDLWM